MPWIDHAAYLYEHFEGFLVRSIPRHRYARHGITVIDDTNLKYSVEHCGNVLEADYSFESTEKLDEWCVYVVNIKDLAEEIPNAAYASHFVMGTYFLGTLKTTYSNWLKVVNHFIAAHGVEKIPDDIKGAMKMTEENLCLPITFPDAENPGIIYFYGGPGV